MSISSTRAFKRTDTLYCDTRPGAKVRISDVGQCWLMIASVASRRLWLFTSTFRTCSQKHSPVSQCWQSGFRYSSLYVFQWQSSTVVLLCVSRFFEHNFQNLHGLIKHHYKATIFLNDPLPGFDMFYVELRYEFKNRSIPGHCPDQGKKIDHKPLTARRIKCRLWYL